LGQDGVAVVVHPQLSVAGLTAANLRDIFSGTATDWSELGWESQEIVVVSREAGADIRQAFELQVMGQRRITLSARLATSDQAMLAIVANTPGAVGYMSMAATDSRVKTVPVAATVNDPLVMPTPQTIADGRYPLRMPLIIVGEEAPVPGDGYYEFIIWAQGEGQEVIARSYAPLP
jgi:phosphate transport system substrate-binding protein